MYRYLGCDGRTDGVDGTRPFVFPIRSKLSFLFALAVLSFPLCRRSVAARWTDNAQLLRHCVPERRTG